MIYKMMNGEFKKVGVMNPEPYRFDLVPPGILMGMAIVMAEGLKDHPEGGWKDISPSVHVGRAMGHLVRWMMGDHTGGNHLSHAACRVAFAIEQSRLAPLTSLKDTLGDSHQGIQEAPSVQPQGCSGGRPGDSGVSPHPPTGFRGVSARSPFVYLAHPYRDDPIVNVGRATQLGHKLQYQLNNGKSVAEETFVLVPHNICRHMSEELERFQIMRMCRSLVGMCSHLYLKGGVMTHGMTEELQEARRLGIPCSMVHDHGDVLAFSSLEGEE